MIENISDIIYFFGKPIKKDIKDAHIEIQTRIISASVAQKCLTTQLKKIGTSRKKSCVDKKFRLQIDKNDELACWVIIYRQAYKDRMRERVKYIA